MKFIYKITTSVLIFFFAITNLFSITGEEAVAKFKSRMFGIQKLTGIISWSVQSGQTYTGTFKYLNPGKIYVKFSNPQGKILVSNGNKLWVYNSASNICGVQDLASGFSGGIAGIVNDYMAIVTSRGPHGYTLKLKNNDKVYTNITLMLDSTFFLKKAIIKNKDGEGFKFSISNIDASASVMKSLFDFDVPANAQIVKNPLNIK